MRKGRIRIWPAVPALLAAVLFSGCGPRAGGTKTAAQATRTKLIIAMANEPDVLDVQQASWEDIPHSLISQPLVSFDLELENLVPDWAESWEVSADGKTVTWKLPGGYQYSNGDTLDAQALADTWKRYKEISPYAEDLEPITAMNVLDASTLEVVHSAPPAFLWAVLATTYGAPWNAAEADRLGNEQFGRTPVASGLFKLKEWVEGSHILLARNENYRTHLPLVKNRGPAHLEEVMIRFIPEGLTRLGELEAGSVDIMTDVPNSEVANLEQNPGIELIDRPTAGMSYLVFNNQRPPFSDVRVRGALASALNRDDLVSVLAGTVDPQYAFLAPAQLCYSEEMQQYAKELHPYHVEAAKGLLAEAGWVDTNGDGIADREGKPFTAELLVPTDDPVREKIGVVVQSQLKAVGLDVSIATYESAYIRDLTDDGDYDLALNRVAWSDPDILIYQVTDQGRNYPHYQNPAVKEKLTQARYLMDLAERTAAYSEVQKVLIDDVVYLPLFSRKDYFAVQKWVKDLLVHRLFAGILFLNDVTIVEE